MGNRLAKGDRRRLWAAIGASAVAVGVVIAYGVGSLTDAPQEAVVAGDLAADGTETGQHAIVPDAEKGEQPEPVVVFIGDSYTVGQNTPLEGIGFTERLSELRDWQPVNLAISGTGYAKSHEQSWCPPEGCPAYAGVIDDAVAADPDIVVVSGGRNDMWLEDQAAVATAIAEFYTQLRAAFPTERLIVTSPLWSDGPTPAVLLPIREQVAEQATRVGAEYVDLGDLFEDRPELITDDDIHPTADGLELIAESVDALLTPVATAG
ncbi:SGNH/GDSL hydrolase family protein [Agrococcus baldri]|uniref:SGNH hydrolase-type esterase domain-containing protein n=1 Tax=Agrococcus baldri TaxID=153730 RepID=A0AA87RIF0_9MICO|nr:SGNH/GDSL hydrolase family protein [Agrococcus baldri]GEK81024.1 hypothetical protein ABA31_23750 [Agrococcus baldri]